MLVVVPFRIYELDRPAAPLSGLRLARHRQQSWRAVAARANPNACVLVLVFAPLIGTRAVPVVRSNLCCVCTKRGSFSATEGSRDIKAVSIS